MLCNFLGINFPFGKSANSFPAPAVDAADIKQSVIRCILIATGERVMRPAVGSDALKFVFENNDDLLRVMISAEVLRALSIETRISVSSITVQKQTLNTGSAVVITVQYMILASMVQDTAQITTPSPNP